MSFRPFLLALFCQTSTTISLAAERPKRLSQSATAHLKVADASSRDHLRPNTAVAESPSRLSNQDEKRELTRRTIRKSKPVEDAVVQDDIEGFAMDSGIEGWGDFDADLLLANRSDNNTSSIQLDAYMEKMDKTRPKSRTSPMKNAGRSSAPSVSVSKLHDEPSRSRTAQSVPNSDTSRMTEPVRPVTEVLRQRKLEAMEFDFPSEHAPVYTPKRAALSGSQRRRKSKQRLDNDFGVSLPIIFHSVTTPALQEPTIQDPIFGSHIPNDEATRTLVGESLLKLWALMSPIDQAVKSAFECSMVVLKLYKSVGISLSSAGPTSLSFWRSASHTSDQYVEFSEFFDFAIRGIFQPALHHYKLDRTIDDFVQTIESTIACLVENQQEESMNLKELGDVHTILPVWKSCTPGCIDSAKRRCINKSDAPETEDEHRDKHSMHKDGSLPVFVGMDSDVEIPVTKQASTSLFVHESQEFHNRSVQQKVQLRSSWKRKLAPHTEHTLTESSAMGLTNFPLAPPLGTILTAKECATERAAQLDGDVSVGAATSFDSTDDTDTNSTKDDLALLCSACSLSTALLWCASCFSVLCEPCWHEIHQSVVDTSQLHGHLTMASAPLCPTVFSLQKASGGDGAVAPGIPIVYFPTKSSSPKRKLRSLGSVNRRRLSSEDSAPLPIAGIVSHSILPSMTPSLKPNQSTSVLERSKSVDEGLSLVDLTKSLMLGVVPRHGVGGDHSNPLSSSSSTVGIAKAAPKLAVVKHQLRPTLRSAAVVLDASQLLPAEFSR